MSDLDPSECRIRTPEHAERIALYEFLIGVFPVDRPVFREMVERGRRFYTWTPYALYHGGELVANVSLMPMQIWLNGQPRPIVGIASVATRERFRRRGVARHLLRHALGIVDERRAPAVLFTELPAVYEGLGFETIPQTYRAASARAFDWGDRPEPCELVGTFGAEHLGAMARLYDRTPNYDGKVVRDAEYWQLYEMLFHAYARFKLLVCRRAGRMVGYARVEEEADRLLVSELCGEPSDVEVVERLLASAAAYARRIERDVISFAMPPGHFAESIVRARGVAFGPEPPGAPRESVMVRPAAGQPLGPLARVSWPLADKF